MVEYTDEIYKRYLPTIKQQIKETRVNDFLPYADCFQEGNLVFLTVLKTFNQNYYNYFGLFLKIKLRWHFINLIKNHIRWGNIAQAMSLDKPVTDKVTETFLEQLEDMTANSEVVYFNDIMLQEFADAMENTVYADIKELLDDGYKQFDISTILKISQSSVSRHITFIKEATQLYFETGVLLKFEDE